MTEPATPLDNADHGGDFYIACVIFLTTTVVNTHGVDADRFFKHSRIVPFFLAGIRVRHQDSSFISLETVLFLFHFMGGSEKCDEA